MPRFVLLAVLLVHGLAPQAAAQIYRVNLKGEDAEKKYSTYLVEFEGSRFLLGEGKDGIQFDASNGQLTMDSVKIELYLADPKDPAKLPYKWKNGERVSAGKRGVLQVSRADIDTVGLQLPAESLQSLADEFVRRSERVEALEDQTQDLEQGSDAWFASLRRQLEEMRRLQAFLGSTLFPEAAEGLGKDIAKFQKKMSEGALARGERAQEVKKLDPDERLIEASAKADPAFEVHVHESQHLRLVHGSELPDEEAVRLIQLAEQGIEGFRSDLIDPYVSETLPDNIPQGLFIEIVFGPSKLDWQKTVWVEYYGQLMPPEQALEPLGWNGNAYLPHRALSVWRQPEDDDADLAGIVVHMTGRALAQFHYNNAKQDVPVWIDQGLAYWLSIEYLGRNSVHSVPIDEDKQRYARQKDESKAQMPGQRVGVREFFEALALAEGEKIELLAQRSLADMDDADIAKAWSFIDYLANAGQPGQWILFAACECRTAPEGFSACWRAKIEEYLAIESGDAYRAMDDLWRQHAGG